MSTRFPSEEGHLPGSPVDIERQRRTLLLERIRNNPYLFVGPDREHDDADPAISPQTGSFCVLVPSDAPARFWEDPRLRLGVCNYFPEPADAASNAQCPYEVVSLLAAPNLDLLYAGAFIEQHHAYPDMSRLAIIRDLSRRFRPVKLELDAVRVGDLLDDPDLVGGEPQLRWTGTHLAVAPNVTDPAWSRTRQTLEHFAAAAVVPPDAGWQTAAFRLLIWTIPFAELSEQRVVRVRTERARWRLATLLFLRDRRQQLIAPQLLGRSPEGRGRISRRAWRSMRLSRRLLRRRWRRTRTVFSGHSTSVRAWLADFAREEVGYHEPDLAKRAAKRDIFFRTLRRFGALFAAPVVLIKTPLLQVVGELLRWFQKLLS
jgi:hypothetical protein